MIRKLLMAVPLVLGIGAVAQAQTFDPNMIFTVGASYRLQADPAASNRWQVVVTAGLPGLKVTDNLFGGTLYTLSPGLGLRTIDVANGATSGIGAALGGLTYHFKGGQFVGMAGAFRDVTGDEKSTTVYVSVGGSVTSPKAIAARRAAKKAERERRELLAQLYPDLHLRR